MESKKQSEKTLRSHGRRDWWLPGAGRWVGGWEKWVKGVKSTDCQFQTSLEDITCSMVATGENAVYILKVSEIFDL